MFRSKASNRVELKYCEGCGCLLTRPVGSGLSFCAPCEDKHSENRFLTPPRKRSPRNPRLPNPYSTAENDIEAWANDEAWADDDSDLEACA